MNRTISFWMLLGITVACCWVAAAYFVPNSNPGRSTIAALTAPAAFFGRTTPLGVVPFVLLNGVLYGAVGLIIASMRRLAAHSSP
jgi:hypothetical protein